MLPLLAIAGLSWYSYSTGLLASLATSIKSHVGSVTAATTAAPPSTTTNTATQATTLTPDSTPVYDTSRYPDASRVQTINNVYRSVLGRQVDPGGLATYYSDGVSASQLAYILLSSPEYAQRCTAPAVCS